MEIIELLRAVEARLKGWEGIIVQNHGPKPPLFVSSNGEPQLTPMRSLEVHESSLQQVRQQIGDAIRGLEMIRGVLG